MPVVEACLLDRGEPEAGLPVDEGWPLFWRRLLVGGEGIRGGAKCLEFEIEFELSCCDKGEAPKVGIDVCDLLRRVAAGLERGEGEPVGVSCGDSRELISIFTDSYRRVAYLL